MDTRWLLSYFFGLNHMTTLIKTQCPSCQAYFSSPQAQLNELDAKARCGRCQQVFLVNENLVVSGDDHLPNDNASSSLRKNQDNTFNKPNDDSLLSDLIYDDMPIDDFDESNLEYNPLDEMSAWFSELDTTQIDSMQEGSIQVASGQTVIKDNNSSIKHDKQNTSSDDSDYVVNVGPQHTVSSASANDINTFIQDTKTHADSDNAWLEKLLDEQKDNRNAIDSDTDLSQLLASMGAPIRVQSQISPRQVSKGQSRIYPAQTRAQTSAASVLWVIGCLVLIMLLFAQYVIFNLDNIVKNPEHAARLQAVCAVAACSLPSADMTAFDITNLAYKSSQIKADNMFSDIGATLVNQSQKAQLLPSLKVSIYTNDALIGEFIATPKDYLASKQHSLSAEQSKSFLFTVPVASNQISQVTVDPIY